MDNKNSYNSGEDLKKINDIILKASEKADKETSHEPEPEYTKPLEWPINCAVGPGLEGAIACETTVGYVNGAKGWLLYRGYNIFDLCVNSTYEEVSYLLLHGSLPTKDEFREYKDKLIKYRNIPKTQKLMAHFPLETMNPMAMLRMGSNFMRHEFTYKAGKNNVELRSPSGMEACHQLIAGFASVAAAVSRLREGRLPIEPDPELSHAANLIYMITGERPNPVEERIMDIALILHADHGMNASTFASLVVASTLSDIYFSVGAGIAALNGPLHGGANEKVMEMLNEIGGVENVKQWLKKTMREKKKIMGFGHRVYKTYDPRARVLGPLAEFLSIKSEKAAKSFKIARALENEVNAAFGAEKHIFPNVDYYSGIVYSAMDIDASLFTPIFAVSRVAGWTARVQEYLEHNRLFRPRAMYHGEYDKKYTSIDRR